MKEVKPGSAAGDSARSPSSARPPVIVTCVLAVVMAGTTAPSPLYALYSKQMDFGLSTTTIIFAVYAAGVLCALITAGSWSDAVGRRPILISACVLAIASDVTFLLAHNVSALLIARVLSGVSAGLCSGAATAAIIESTPHQWGSERAALLASIANMGGLAIGPLLGGALAEYGPAPLHLVFAVHLVLTVLGAIGIALIPETSPYTGTLDIQRLTVPVTVKPVFVVAAMATFAGFSATALFTAAMPTFLADLTSITNAALGGLLVTTALATSSVAQLAAGRIRTRRALIIGCLLLATSMVSLIAAMVLSSLLLLVAAAFLAGAGQGVNFNRGLTAVLTLAPQQMRAEITSVYFIVVYTAMSVPIVGVGIASQRWDMTTAVTGFAIGVMCLSAICAQQASRTNALVH